MITLLGIPISREPKQELLRRITSSIGQRKSLFVTTPNPEIIVEAQKNSALKEALNCADISLPDGTGIVLALRSRGQKITRLPGREFFTELLELANKNAWSVYLLGSTKGSLSNSLERIRREYSSVQVNGRSAFHVNQYGMPLNGEEETEVLAEITKANPNILFVAFGHPKQELWSHRLQDKFPQTTIMTIGGTLDYFGGTVPMPPQIVSKVGFEWLFRLLTQPKRLKRILHALIVFPWLIITTRK